MRIVAGTGPAAYATQRSKRLAKKRLRKSVTALTPLLLTS